MDYNFRAFAPCNFRTSSIFTAYNSVNVDASIPGLFGFRCSQYFPAVHKRTYTRA